MENDSHFEEREDAQPEQRASQVTASVVEQRASTVTEQIGLEESGTPKPDLSAPVILPEIPSDDFGFSFSEIIGTSSNSTPLDKVQKRASNVQKLAQENEKLKEELRAMSERIEAAETRRKQLAARQQKTAEPTST